MNERPSAWAALPDALTALAFAVVWIHPFAFGPLSVKTAMLTMLVEFILIHATGFLTVIAHGDTPRAKRVLAIAGISGFYLLFITAFAWSFGEWWPFLAFLWLVVGKLAWSLRRGVATSDQVASRMAAWAGSVVAYLFACFATIMAPIPTLGMPLSMQPQFGFDAGQGGIWVDEPHRVVAMGFLYFGLLAAGKFWVARASAPKNA